MSDLRVGFRASVPVAMTHRPLLMRDLWTDQPTPPPPIAHEYTDPPDPPYRTWPPGAWHEKGTAQQRRIKATLFMVGNTELDEAACRFTYRRCSLVGVVTLADDGWARDQRWTGHGYRQLGAMDAASTVLLVLRCALHQVYEYRPPQYGTISDIPLPGLAVALRELR